MCVERAFQEATTAFEPACLCPTPKRSSSSPGMSAVSRWWDGLRAPLGKRLGRVCERSGLRRLSGCSSWFGQHRGVSYSSDMRKTNATERAAKKATPVRRRNRATDTENEADHRLEAVNLLLDLDDGILP